MLVIISGVSGVGKNTVIKNLMKDYDNIYFFKSATTRPYREGDQEIYINLTPEVFEQYKTQGEFFETEEVHGYMYGTKKADLKKIIENQQNIYIKDIDVHGNRRFRTYLKGKAKFLSIFLEAPDEVLFERLINRGETEERARIRISRSKMEREYKSDYDLIIENIDLQKTLSIIKDRLKQEGINTKSK